MNRVRRHDCALHIGDSLRGGGDGDAGFVGPGVAEGLGGVVFGGDGVENEAGVDHPDFQGVGAGLGDLMVAGGEGGVAEDVFLPGGIVFAEAGGEGDDLRRGVVEGDGVALRLAGFDGKGRERAQGD